MTTRLSGALYKRVFAEGTSIRSRLAVAWWRSAQEAQPQAGVVVSKRTFHDAVDRNRAKRILREAFRLLAKEGAAPENTQWVFIGRGALEGKKCADVMRDMRWIFSKCARS